MRSLPVRIGASLGLAILALACWLRPVDALAERYVDEGLQRSLVTFAAARGLNAMLSVAQSATVGGSVGVSASVQPGEILDPVNDLVEQFSSLMLAVSVSFAAQKLLLGLSASWAISLSLSLMLLWVAFRVWKQASVPVWLQRGALLLLCLRFTVPVIAVGSELAYRASLSSTYETSQQGITASDGRELSPGSEASWWERVRNWDPNKQIEAIKARAEGWINHIVKLSAVFVVQTLVLPLLFLWSLVLACRSALARYGASIPPGLAKMRP